MAASAFFAVVAISTFSVAIGAVDQGATTDVLAAEDLCGGSSEPSCALNELQSGARATKNSIELPAPAKGLEDDQKCAIIEIDSKDIPGPIEMGTQDNMYDVNYPEIDLTGMWWIRWTKPWSANSLADWATRQLFHKLELEILMSFSYSNGTGPGYPMNLSQPVAIKRHFTYGDTWASKFYMALGREPVGSINWTFINSSFAMAPEPFNYEMIKKNADEWEQPTHGLQLHAKGASEITISDTVTYMMTRIVYANGTKSKHWPAWLKEGPKQTRAWNTNNDCKRFVESWSDVLGTPNMCSLANKLCSDENTTRQIEQLSMPVGGYVAG